MRTLRTAVAWLLVLGLSSSAFAGDLKDSVAKAAEEQAEKAKVSIPKPYLWTGSVLVVTGMAMAVYGFLHTSGGEFVSGQVSTESKTKLGSRGLRCSARAEPSCSSVRRQIRLLQLRWRRAA